MVIFFTFSAIVLSNILVSIVFCLYSESQHLILSTLTINIIVENAIKMLNALGATGMSLIPLFFGLKNYSIPATITSSILIVAIVCSNSNGFTLNHIILIPITLALIGAYTAYLAIRNIEKVDLI